jgi:hypothetical protein
MFWTAWNTFVVASALLGFVFAERIAARARRHPDGHDDFLSRVLEGDPPSARRVRTVSGLCLLIALAGWAFPL